MPNIITARGLQKSYGKSVALKSLDFAVESGRILGVIGPNGSGKTTLLKAILGMTPYLGELSVLGFDPTTQRDALMEEVCFVADVAVLPRWLSVSQAVDFVEGIHPRFNREKAEHYLAATKLQAGMKVKEMSKGMLAQLHLSLVMAIDAKLLILDEPTLGLDIMYRKLFYLHLMEDYFDHEKTIIIATHQVEEIENILSDVMFIRDGEIVLQTAMEGLQQRFMTVAVRPECHAQALALQPVAQQKTFDRQMMLFDGIDPANLHDLGEIQLTSLSEIFVQMMKGSYQ